MKVAQPPPVSNQLQDPDRPTIVCLCGSTRFYRQFQKQSLIETLNGNIVLSIGAATGTDEDHFGNLSAEEFAAVKTQLDELHLRKIDLADEIFVLNVSGYIGESTRREVLYAYEQGKRIRWLEDIRPHALTNWEWKLLRTRAALIREAP